jgi:hypothetical protein
MVPSRHSAETTPNDLVKEEPAKPGESNRQWLSRVGARDGIILLGGSSLAHFRIRVAQSHLRSDLLPSFWSLTGILKEEQAFVSVPLGFHGDTSEVPRTNGIQTCRLDDYDDPERFPNIAVIRFTEDSQAVHENIERLRQQRSVIDLPSLMLPWLGFVWGAGRSGNPLLEGHGLPSAAFVETVYGIAGIELTPGLSSASSCPEAIWQSAKWWRAFYEGATGVGNEVHAIATVPAGSFATRQSAAAVVEHRPGA